METPKTGEFAHIGKSVVIKGELSGSEDLYVDGTVDGTVELATHRFIVGPSGQVRAGVNAKGVVIEGKLEGNIQAGERVELRKSASVTGNIAAPRIAIEEGAYFKGKIDVRRDAKQEGKSEAAPAVAASAAAVSGTQTPVTVEKKI